MRKLLLAVILILLFTPHANAAEGQPVTFPSGTQTARGLLYLPSGAGPHPAIVVIHEWWGVNDWVKEQAARYAAQGYVALAVDLYRGQVAHDAELAHELMRGLPEDQGVRDLTSAVAYLKTRPEVKGDSIGAVGWCMGGGYAINLAVAEPTLKAVAVNYGALPSDRNTLSKLHASVLGNFGGQDRGISPEKVQAFRESLQQLGKDADIKVYSDAGHAFENPNNKDGYKPADAADAQQRMDRFFAAKLGK